MKQAVREFTLREGQVPKVMNVQNPAEQRRLSRKLSKLEQERKKRESALTWTQRNFFMKQVFDQDKELRFVKAQQRPKYKPPKFETKQCDFDAVVDTLTYANEIDVEEKEEVSKETEETTSPSRPTSASPKKEIEHTLPPIGQPISPEEPLNGTKMKDTFGAGNMRRMTSPREKPMFLRVRHIYDTKHFVENKSDNTEENNNNVATEENQSSEEQDTVPEINADTQEVSNTAMPAPKKTKFPVLKVKALGLFAASMKKAQGEPPKSAAPVVPLPKPGRQSVSLPNSPTIKRKDSSARHSSAKSLDDKPLSATKAYKKTLPSFDDKNICSKKTLKSSKRKSHTATRPSLSSESQKLTPRSSISKCSSRIRTSQTRERQDPQKNIWQRVTTMPEESSVLKCNKDKADSNFDQMGIVDIEDCDQDFVEESVIRRLVKTLPTDMLVKSVNREKEAGGLSTGDARRMMLEKAKHKMSRRVVLDPRFKRLENSLAGT